MTWIMFAIGALFGSAVTVFALTGPVDVLRLIVRPLAPFWCWVSIGRNTAGTPLRNEQGQIVRWVNDGDKWVGIYTDARHGWCSPLLLAPAGLIRLSVRLFGANRKFSLPGDPTRGYILKTLTVAPGVRLARRSKEDLAYLREHHRFRTVLLTLSNG